ncbi:MAG: ArsR family transcriptional regulator [Chloroflexi bacterium]|jgi:predicted ArsR family transcriptional regulator|nr:ArsR family transcriptional regulator [Chloroflexota bacterium]
MVTSRQRLLDYIREHQAVTVSEISRALRMTPANARHHLSILTELNLVEAVSVRAGRGKGRPSQVYSLSRRARGNNLAELASAVFEHFLDPMTSEERQAALQEIAETLEKKLSPEAPLPRGHLTQRLVQAVQRLNQMRYHARWEAHAQGPQIILSRCPYEDLVQDHPEVCQLDQALLERLLGTRVRQTARLEQDKRGLPCCRFVVVQERTPE